VSVETRAIGSLKVSLVGLGCNNFGMRLDEERSTAVVHAALDAGIDFFDTADTYGGTKSEEFLGRALGGRRDEVVIATKFGMSLGDDRGGASARWIVQAAEDSLRRLGTDRIDLYQQHLFDDSVPLDETLEALDQLVSAGKVLHIGNSNFTGEQIAEADDISKDHGWARFVSAQNQFSLVSTGARQRILPVCVERGLGFLPYFPLGSGLLTGKYQRDAPPPAGTRLAAMPQQRVDAVLNDRNFDRVDALDAFARSRDHSLLELAFAWLAAQPALASIIAGATSPDQVRANTAAVDWHLTPDDLTEIDAILAASRTPSP
jgi:aryl-alcohol dehydrogenase-like predicted oxidoreductase